MEFPPDQLDLDRLLENLASRRLELIQYRAIVEGLDPGDEQTGWVGEVTRIENEVSELEGLIEAKRSWVEGE